MKPETRKQLSGGFYAAVGGVIVVGILNAVTMWNQSQIFQRTTTDFVAAQSERNTKQDITNEQLKVSVAELKQQTGDISRRLEIMEQLKVRQ